MTVDVWLTDLHLSVNFSITVVSVSSFSVTSTPSSLMYLPQLSSYENGALSAHVILSDGTRHFVDSLVNYTASGVCTVSSHIISPSTTGSCNINASLSSLSTSLSLSVLGSTTTVTAIENLTIYSYLTSAAAISTLNGVNGTLYYIEAAIILSDTTTAMISSKTTAVSLSVSSQALGIVSSNFSTLLSLLGTTSSAMITLSIGNATLSVTVACNMALNPAQFDIDLGSLTGVAVPNTSPLIIPIFLSAPSSVGAISFQVSTFIHLSLI